MTTKFALGVYLGETAGSAQYDASLSDFITEVGEAPTVFNQSLGYVSGEEVGWVQQTQALAGHLASSPGGTSNIPLLSLPMFSADQTSALAGFAKVTSGAYDSYWTGIVDAYANQGFKTIDIRPGWEMNGTWYPWSVTSAAGATAFIGAWQHMVTVMRAEATKDGVSVQFVWTPSTLDDSAVPTSTMYPGNSYVDMIGTDIYDTVYPETLYDWSTGKIDSSLAQWMANPVNLEHYWDYPDATAGNPTGTARTWGLIAAMNFAAQQGKPFALPEAGTTGNAATSPLNDALFPQYLASRLLAHGAPSLALVTIWEKIGSGYQFSNGVEPAVAAAWANFITEMNQGDAGPSVGSGSITVASNQTDDLTAALQAAITPGRTGDTETISHVSAVTGTVSIAAGGDILYAAGAAGTDTLTWTVTDQLGHKVTTSTTIIIDGGPTINTAAVKVATGQTVTLASLSSLLVTPGLTGDTETFSNVTAALGTITVGANGVISYTPPSSGSDTLSYTVTDEAGNAVTGSSTISIDPGPSLALGGGGATPGASLALNYLISSLITPGLTGDTETITAISDTAGRAILAANGTITYTAPASGRDTITYTVTDQLGDTATGTYLVTVNPADVQGTVLHFGAATDLSWGSADPGVTVNLLTASGSLVASLVTNSTGFFNFTNLLPGSYELAYVPPTGQVFQSGTKVVSTATGLTAVFAVAASQTYYAASVPMVAAAAFAGQVVSDGVGESGVTVTLEPASGTNVTAVSDSNGNFTFNSLVAGNYQLLYSAPTDQYLAPGGPANTATGLTGAYTLAAGQLVTLPAETLDTYATIQGVVAYANGSAAGVVVTLLGAAGAAITSVTTGADGAFSFSGIVAGSYQVEYNPPVGEAPELAGQISATTGLATVATTLSTGQTVTLATEAFIPDGVIRGAVAYTAGSPAGVLVKLLDSSGNVVATATTGSAGTFSFAGLAAQAYQVAYQPPIGEAPQIPGQISALTGLATVSASLATGQTLKLATETLVPDGVIQGSVTYSGGSPAGVVVSLLDLSGAVLATQTTTATGSYSFTGLVAGAYSVQFAPPGGEVPQLASQINATTGLATVAATLAAGQDLKLATEGFNPPATAPGTVEGTVYLATGASNLLRTTPQSGVTLSLINSSGAVLATTLSTSVGWYKFANVAPGSYQVKVTPPSFEALEPNWNVDTTSGLTAVFSLAAGQAVWLSQALVVAATPTAGALTGEVVYQNNPQYGVAVTLLNAAGLAIASTTTDSTGTFSFTGLTAGKYQLHYTPPINEVAMPGGLANAATDVAGPEFVSAGETLSVGTETLIVGYGSLTGTVLTDGAAAAGVTVNLTDAAGTDVLATATTNATGGYTFSNLANGSYAVQFIAPRGLVLQTGGLAAPSGLAPAVTVVAGQTTTVGAESLLSKPAVIEGQVNHLGSADPVWGTSQYGVTVSLQDAAGTLVASKVTNALGWFQFTNLATGSYQLVYSPTADEVLQSAAPALVSVAAGQTLFEPEAYVVSISKTFALTGTNPVALRGDGNYTVTGNPSGGTLVLGGGNDSVTLTGSGNAVTTGDGNETITLSGTGNQVTVGTGTSTINAGSGGAVVQADGGNVTITAGGANNLFNSGAGTNFLHSDGSAGNVFDLNAGRQGLSTITGFNMATTDVLDLARTLSGVSILADLSNIGTYLSASVSGGTTTLYVDVDSGGGAIAASAIAVLSGVSASVASLLSGNHLSMA